jgi:SpoVK/Ycf46/Vps4 family AAA+-type ATPase
MNRARIYVDGIPESVPEVAASICRSRIYTAIDKLVEETNLESINISIYSDNQTPKSITNSVGGGAGKTGDSSEDEISVQERAKQYTSESPLYDFSFLVVPDDVLKQLTTAIAITELTPLVFDTWGLRRIEPFPSTALNFYGPPGTGKTLAAQCLAHHIGAKILSANYGQIESKFQAEGPKNLEALFAAAERDGAVLFIDEADALLSKRFTSVSQGSELASNALRNQLFNSLDRFRGVVIFATNLVETYDRAVETRVRNIRFTLPDEPTREKIWRNHLGDGMSPPLSPDVSLADLAKIDDICGREIRNAIIDAAMNAAMQKRTQVSQADFVEAIERIKSSRIDHPKPPSGTPADEETTNIILKAIESGDLEKAVV